MAPERGKRAFRIQDGKVSTIPLGKHPDWFLVPESIKHVPKDGDEGFPVHLLQGKENEFFKEHTLPMILETATRVTPWATWYMAPEYTCEKDTRGTAWPWSDTTVIRSSRHSATSLATAYHESWHLCEYYMDESLLEVLDDAFAKGPMWPGDYLPRKVERRARAFENFAMALSEGCRLLVEEDIQFPEVRVFQAVLTGAFGKEVLALKKEAAEAESRGHGAAPPRGAEEMKEGKASKATGRPSLLERGRKSLDLLRFSSILSRHEMRR